MEYACSKSGVNSVVFEKLIKILRFSRTSAGDNGNFYCSPNCTKHREIKAPAYTVGIHGIQDYLAGAEILAVFCPFNSVDTGVGSSAIGKNVKLPLTRLTSILSTTHWLP